MSNSRLIVTISSVLSHRYLLFALALLAVLIHIPTLGSGWRADDLIHRAKLIGSLPLGGRGATNPNPHELPSAIMDLFIWADPDKNIRPFMDFGSIPWWTFDGLRCSFWRPITSLTYWVDYRLWPNSAALMHAHSLLWFFVVIALITCVYRRLMAPAWVAGLAALLFTLDDLHYGTVGWLASRYVLLAFSFGLLAILAHDRWRREGLCTQGFLSSVWLLLALFAGEAGLGTIAYLTAYALFLDQGLWRKRFLSLIPYIMVVAVWRIIYRYLGYAVYGSDFYVDPTSQPLQFISGIIKIGPILLLGLLGEPDPYTYCALSSTGSYLLWVFAILFLIIIFILLLPLFRRDRVACFWAVGMVLCIVPSCASQSPSGRLVFFASLGGVGLVAQVIGGIFGRHNWVPINQIMRSLIWALTILFMGLHLGMPAWQIFNRFTQYSYFVSKFEWKPWPALPQNVEKHDVIIINHPNPFSYFYLPYYSTIVGNPLPTQIRTLAPGFSAVEVTKIDNVTLAVRSECGFLSTPSCFSKNESAQYPIVSPIYSYQLANSAFRGRAHALKLGESIELSGVRIEVARLSKDGYPLEATFRFQRPLEDTSMKWFSWDWQSKSYKSFALPAPGKTIRIAGPFE